MFCVIGAYIPVTLPQVHVKDSCAAATVHKLVGNSSRATTVISNWFGST